MKFIDFSIFVGHFLPIRLSGSRDPIESGSNPDSDLQHYLPATSCYEEVLQFCFADGLYGNLQGRKEKWHWWLGDAYLFFL